MTDALAWRAKRRASFRLAWQRTVPLLWTLALAGCATTGLESAVKLIRDGQPLQGLAQLREASERAPTSAELRTRYLLELDRFLAARLAQAGAALEAGDVAAARQGLAQALAAAPGHEAARALVREADAREQAQSDVEAARRALEAGDPDTARRRLESALAASPGHAPARRLAEEIEHRAGPLRLAAQRAREAASPLGKPVSLQVRDASLRSTLEALARATGLNLVIDNDVRRDLKVTLSVQGAPLGDVLDLMLMQAQLARRTVNLGSVYVYPATEAKQRDFQELEVRTFQLSNADAKQVAATLRTLLKLREVVVDERAGTLVLREPPQVLAVAEQIVRAQDRADPEVMLELEVLEVSRDRLANLGVKLPDAVTLSVPAGGTAGGNTVGELRALRRDDLVVSPLSVGVNLRLADTDANLLASPRIRARHRQPARVMIGDKVPVITNTVTPLQTGSAVVTGAIQYLDVGIKLQVEPEIHADAQVGIKLSLEVSNIVREIAGPSGSLAYQIGTRNAETVLRLRDGETQVLAGLISDQARNTAAKVPGLGQLPVLGALFASRNVNAAKSEIVLSITPRIVRPVAVVPATLQQIASGTEAYTRPHALSLDPVATPAGAATPAPVRVAPGLPPPASTVPGEVAPLGTGAGAALPPGAADPSVAPVPSGVRRTRPRGELELAPQESR